MPWVCVWGGKHRPARVFVCVCEDCLFFRDTARVWQDFQRFQSAGWLFVGCLFRVVAADLGFCSWFFAVCVSWKGRLPWEPVSMSPAQWPQRKHSGPEPGCGESWSCWDGAGAVDDTGWRARAQGWPGTHRPPSGHPGSVDLTLAFEGTSPEHRVPGLGCPPHFPAPRILTLRGWGEHCLGLSDTEYPSPCVKQAQVWEWLLGLAVWGSCSAELGLRVCS